MVVRQLLGFTVLVALSAPGAQAQMPSYEFGVDVGITSTKRDGFDGRILRIGSPVDVRLGFVTSRPLMLETRFRLGYTRTDDAWGLNLGPSLNILWRFVQGRGFANQMGPYMTAGAGVEYTRVKGPATNGTQGATQFGVTFGVGSRIAWGTAAFRPELFIQRAFESHALGEPEHVPASSTLGARVGISLWR